MIKIENLHKGFNGSEILKGIDLSVSEGEVVSIIGPSGTGKSTLLRCLNYLEEPENGSLIIDDLNVNFRNISKDEIHILRSKTSMVFQNYNLFRNKTAIENVMEVIHFVQKRDKRFAYDESLRLLKLVGLVDRKDYYPSKLSGGQQQRIGIARAMAVHPKVMLIDEPTSALDPELVGEVLEVIRNLAEQDMTMLIVTHEMEFAKSISDRIVFLDDGVVVEEGSPEKMFGNPDCERTIRFLKKIDNKNI